MEGSEGHEFVINLQKKNTKHIKGKLENFQDFEDNYGDPLYYMELPYEQRKVPIKKDSVMNKIIPEGKHYKSDTVQLNLTEDHIIMIQCFFLYGFLKVEGIDFLYYLFLAFDLEQNKEKQNLVKEISDIIQQNHQKIKFKFKEEHATDILFFYDYFFDKLDLYEEKSQMSQVIEQILGKLISDNPRLLQYGGENIINAFKKMKIVSFKDLILKHAQFQILYDVTKFDAQDYKDYVKLKIKDLQKQQKFFEKLADQKTILKENQIKSLQGENEKLRNELQRVQKSLHQQQNLVEKLKNDYESKIQEFQSQACMDILGSRVPLNNSNMKSHNQNSFNFQQESFNNQNSQQQIKPQQSYQQSYQNQNQSQNQNQNYNNVSQGQGVNSQILNPGQITHHQGSKDCQNDTYILTKKCNCKICKNCLFSYIYTYCEEQNLSNYHVKCWSCKVQEFSDEDQVNASQLD